MLYCEDHQGAPRVRPQWVPAVATPRENSERALLDMINAPFNTTGACLLFDHHAHLVDDEGNNVMSPERKVGWERFLRAMVQGRIIQPKGATTCPDIDGVMLLNPIDPQNRE